MGILKWYSIVFLVLSLIISIYNNGKKTDGAIMTFLELLLITPIIIYIAIR